MQKQNRTISHKLSIGIALTSLIFFTVFFYKSLKMDSSKTISPLVGKPAHAFQVQLLQGGELLLGHASDRLDLEALKGSPLVINFWASWCSSCAQEAHVLESFWKQHSAEGVKVLGIAVHDKAEDVRPFLASHGKTYAIALDEEGRIALDYGVTGVPETVFINAQGVLVHKEVGPLTPKLLEQALEKLKAGST